MKNKMVLLFTCFISFAIVAKDMHEELKAIQQARKELTSIVNSGYRYIGQDALKHLAESGECYHCDLSYQDLREALQSLACAQGGVNLRNSNLQGIMAVSANLKKADLSYTNLRYANLFCANCIEAKFKCADVTGASMVGARFEENEEPTFVELSAEEVEKSGQIGRVFVQVNKPKDL